MEMFPFFEKKKTTENKSKNLLESIEELEADKTDVLKLVDIVTDTVLEDGVCHGLQKIGLI